MMNKLKKHLTDISNSTVGMKVPKNVKYMSQNQPLGTLSSMVDLIASKKTYGYAKKARNRASFQSCRPVAVLEERKSASTLLRADLRSLNSYGTFLWPNMAMSSNKPSPGISKVHVTPSVVSSTPSAPPQLPHHHEHPSLQSCRPVAVLEERKSASTLLRGDFRSLNSYGTFLWPNMAMSSNKPSPGISKVHVTPSVVSSTPSAPPQLPHHHEHPPTSPIRPVPAERPAVSVKTARSFYDQQNAKHGYYFSTTIIPSSRPGISTVHVTPSVVSSTPSAPPQLPHHHQHPPTSPIRPVSAERPAVSVTVKTARSFYDEQNAIIPSSRGKNDTTLTDLSHIIPDSDDGGALAWARRLWSAFRGAITKCKESLFPSTRLLPRKNCGGRPKREPKEQLDKSKQVKEGEAVINLDDHLIVDLLKGNETLDTVVVHQGDNQICGPLSVSDNVGLTYALQQQTRNKRERPILGPQELIEWLIFQEPDYMLNRYLHEKMKHTEDGASLPVSLVDLFDYIVENGIHLECNYPLKGASKKKFPENLANYERMRSTYVDGEPRQRFSFDKYRHAVVNDENKEDAIEEIKRALQEKRPVNAMIWASKAFQKFNKNGIFDQELKKSANHIVLIVGYGEYDGVEYFKIKNTWGSTWAQKGFGYIAVRQVREFAYVQGNVFCMGARPPKKVMVYYTTDETKELAEEFAKESNKEYRSTPSTCRGQFTYCRHADFIFIPSDLEDYARTGKHLKLKLQKESVGLFILDNKRADEKRFKLMYKLFPKRRKDQWLGNFEYALFGLHSINNKTDVGLRNLGARPLVEPVIDDGYEGTFENWKRRIWAELDKE